MFGLEHFIWLGIATIVISLIVFLNKKFKFSFEQNITAFFVVATISEFVKISTSIVIDDQGGGYLDPGDLPFHLCSIHIFLIYSLKFFVKKESTKQILLTFMFPTMLIGATLALFIPTGGTDFAKVQLYEYFLYHSYMIGFSFYLILCKVITIDFKTILRNYALLIALAVFALWINSILSYADVNFFYLRRPPLEGLPILNLNNGWFAYVGVILLIGIVSLTTLQLPFAVHNYKKNKLNANQ